MKYTCHDYLRSARGAHVHFGRIKQNIWHSIKESVPINSPRFKWQVQHYE